MPKHREWTEGGEGVERVNADVPDWVAKAKRESRLSWGAFLARELAHLRGEGRLPKLRRERELVEGRIYDLKIELELAEAQRASLEQLAMREAVPA